MLKLYCRHCGSPNIYTLKKPVFCQGCGNNFHEGYAVSEKKSNASEISMPEEDVLGIEEEDEGGFSTEIDGLDIDIDVRGPDTHTFQDLSEAERTVYDNIKPQKTGKKKRGKRKKVNKDTPINLNEGFKSEAGFHPAKENPPK